MTKKLFASAVALLITASAATAAPQFGLTTQHEVNGQGSTVGAVVEDDIFNASVSFGLSTIKEDTSKDGYAKGSEDKSTTIALAGNYKHALSDDTNLLVGGSYRMVNYSNKASEAATAVEPKWNSISVNAGVQTDIKENIKLSVTTAVINMETLDTGADGAEKVKTTKIVDGLNVGLTYLF